MGHLKRHLVGLGLVLIFLGSGVSAAAGDDPAATTRPKAFRFNSDLSLEIHVSPHMDLYDESGDFEEPRGREAKTLSNRGVEIPAGWEWEIWLDDTFYDCLPRLVGQLNKFYRSGGPMPALYLSGTPRVDSGFKALAGMAGPWRLHISGDLMSDNVFLDATMAEVGRFRELRELTLSYCKQITDADFKYLVDISKLSSLRVSRCPRLTNGC